MMVEWEQRSDCDLSRERRETKSGTSKKDAFSYSLLFSNTFRLEINTVILLEPIELICGGIESIAADPFELRISVPTHQ